MTERHTLSLMGEPIVTRMASIEIWSPPVDTRKWHSELAAKPT